MKTHGQIESIKHEKRLAEKYDGTRNAGSGSFWARKNDVRSSIFLIEHKYTSAKKSLSVKVEWLNEVWSNAVKEGLIPVLAFHLGGRNYVILTEDDFDELVEAHVLAGAGQVHGG